jgi:hypothetical protein
MHHPAEALARETSSMTSLISMVHISGPPHAFGIASRNTPAARIRSTTSGGSVRASSMSFGAFTQKRTECAGVLVDIGDAHRRAELQ